MSDLQFLPKPQINSNSTFYYKDITTREKEHRIGLGKERLEIRHNQPVHLRPHAAVKEIEKETYSAFDKAVNETYKIREYHRQKKEIVENKRKIIEKVVEERDQLIKNNLEKEKQELQIILTRVIKDALKFSKENTPMISMMPNKLTNVINHIKEERKTGLNTSSASLNLSLRSNVSARSINKYESNQFLKALGLDLLNLNPNNIKIDIDQAHRFIQKWKVKKEDLNKVIRYKVVNEIMNVEERRSSQKIEKLNKRINKYLTSKKGIKSSTSAEKTSNTLQSLNNSLSLSKTKSLSKPKKSPIKKKRTSISYDRRKTGFKKIQKPVKRVILNAHKNIDKVVKFINSSVNLRENEALVDHFNQIKINKHLEDMTRRMIHLNRIDLK